MKKYVLALFCLMALAGLAGNASAGNVVYMALTPAQAAAEAAAADPAHAPAIAAQAALAHPDQAVDILKAILAVCPDRSKMSSDPASKLAFAKATMAILNAMVAAVPEKKDELLAAASGSSADGYDASLLSSTAAAEAAANAAADPNHAAEIAAQAASDNPDQAVEIMNAVLALTPPPTQGDAASETAFTNATMSIVNAVIAVVPDQTNAIVAVVSNSSAGGYDANALSLTSSNTGDGSGQNGNNLLANNASSSSSSSAGSGGTVSP
ncbi:MAG TPA: hypothetical protein PLF22_00290 [Pseudomonadales bacterium]|nr:hypothetical protein [Pseudomonadales bacterium]